MDNPAGGAFIGQRTETAAYWREPVPIDARRKRRAWILSIGVAASGFIWAMQLANAVYDVRLLFGAIPIAISIFFAREAITQEFVWRYATVYQIHSTAERAKRLFMWWLLPVLGCPLVWAIQYSDGGIEGLKQYWWYTWPLWLVIAVGAFRAFERGAWVLTAEASEAKAQHERDALAQSEKNDPVGQLLSMPLVRYPLSAALIWFAYDISGDPKTKTSLIVALLFLAAFAAYELFFWLLGAGIVIGIGSLIFAGVSALPVSVAIVIGALIIAAAVKK